jgi:hypothetical protein
MAREPEIDNPNDMLNKLSQALIVVSRGDPLVALRNELQKTFDSIDTRFNAIDKATELQHQDQVRVPTQIDKATQGLRDILDQSTKTYIAEVRGELHRHIAETAEKFSGVAAKFSDVATRTDQRAGDIKLAVDAAFAAAKETTAKIEAGFTKQIDSMITIIDTKTENLSVLYNDLKDRLIALESRTTVTTDVRKDSRDNMSVLIAVAALVVAIGIAFFEHR